MDKQEHHNRATTNEPNNNALQRLTIFLKFEQATLTAFGRL